MNPLRDGVRMVATGMVAMRPPMRVVVVKQRWLVKG
jgi:hypothetical protein